VNIQAVESQIQSQVKLADSATLHAEQVRARVLSHLAEQKTISEAFSNGIISAFEKVTGLLDKNLGKLGDVPILGDLLKFGNRQITTKITTDLLDKFFPSEFKESFDKERNPIAAPIVEQQKLTNKYLAAMATGGAIGGSVGSVASSGGGKDIISKFLGMFGLGGGSGNVTSGQVFGSGQNPNNPLIFHNNSNGNSPVPFGSAPEEIARQLRLRQAGEDYPNGGGQPQSRTTTALTTIGSLASVAGGMIGGTAGSFLSNIGGGAAVGGGIGLIKSLFGMGADKKKDRKENLPAL